MKPDLNEAKPFFPWNKGRLVDQKAPLKPRAQEDAWPARHRNRFHEPWLILPS